MYVLYMHVGKEHSNEVLIKAEFSEKTIIFNNVQGIDLHFLFLFRFVEMANPSLQCLMKMYFMLVFTGM